MNSTLRVRWLASLEVISQMLFTSKQPKKNNMAFVGILSQTKLLFGPLVIQLVWYILKQLFTSVSVKVVYIYLHFSEYYKLLIIFNNTEHFLIFTWSSLNKSFVRILYRSPCFILSHRPAKEWQARLLFLKYFTCTFDRWLYYEHQVKLKYYLGKHWFLLPCSWMLQNLWLLLWFLRWKAFPYAIETKSTWMKIWRQKVTLQWTCHVNFSKCLFGAI